MVTWGKVAVPELDQIPLVPGTRAPVEGHHLTAAGTTLHGPTGLRLTTFQSDYNDRGMWQEFYLTPPQGEDWRLELVVSTRISIRSRVIEHLGLTSRDDLPHGTEQALIREMLLTKGEVYECTSAMPAFGGAPATWTAARRDAVLLMLFWAVECNGRYGYRDDPAGPFPSTLIFAPTGVPEALHGTFRNPAWERFQRSTSSSTSVRHQA